MINLARWAVLFVLSLITLPTTADLSGGPVNYIEFVLGDKQFELDPTISNYVSSFSFHAYPSRGKCGLAFTGGHRTGGNSTDFSLIGEVSVPCEAREALSGLKLYPDSETGADKFLLLVEFDEYTSGRLWLIRHPGGMMPMEITVTSHSSNEIHATFEGDLAINPEEGVGTLHITGRFGGKLDFRANADPIAD